MTCLQNIDNICKLIYNETLSDSPYNILQPLLNTYVWCTWKSLRSTLFVTTFNITANIYLSMRYYTVYVFKSKVFKKALPKLCWFTVIIQNVMPDAHVAVYTRSRLIAGKIYLSGDWNVNDKYHSMEPYEQGMHIIKILISKEI